MENEICDKCGIEIEAGLDEPYCDECYDEIKSDISIAIDKAHDAMDMER